MADIYFRTDGNHEIATGHIMRCLAIARACTKRRATAAFIVSDEESISLLRERFTGKEEFPIYCLHSDYREMNGELPALIACLKEAQNPWLFIDSYFASPSYFKTISKHCKTAYLDDLRSFDCPVDLVINYDTSAECSYYNSAADKMLGVQYTPLRTQFQNPPYKVRAKAENILLSTGGTDPYGVAVRLLSAIDNDGLPLLSQSFHYHVITGRMNSRYEALQTMAAKNTHIHIHENVSDMASLMASCDLAVSAGGTTLCELCAVGVPAISYLMADNQQTAVETFARQKIIPCAGDIRSDTEVIDRILSFMTSMSQNIDLRKKSSRAMRAFLDGCGADRIAERLLLTRLPK